MAIAYASKSTTDPTTSSTSVDITKPTGLAEGDLMVAHVSCEKASGTHTVISLPSGWADITNSDFNDLATRYAYKVADSADVAASAFSFALESGKGISLAGGSIIRITGASTSFLFDVDNYTNSSGSPATFSGGITPPADSLLLFFTTSGGTGGNTMTIGSQAIATDNPSWTEIYDSGTILDIDLWMSGAYANRTQATATGNYSCTLSTTASGNTVGCLISIAVPVSVTVSPTVITVTATVQSPTVSGSALVSPTVMSVTVNVQSPTVTIATPKWVNEDKSSAPTYTNQVKS
jgi:hypothetical protein